MSDNSARRDAALKNLDKELKSRARREKMRPLGVVLATVVVLVVLVGGIWFAVTRDNTPDTLAEESTTPAVTPAAMAKSPLTPYSDTVTCSYPESDEAAKAVGIPSSDDIETTGTVEVTFSTTRGDIPVTLDRSDSPCTVNAIEYLASQGYYDDTTCHRVVVADGMAILQCGDPSGTGTGGPGFTFADEYPKNAYDATEVENPVIYPRGTLAMANSGDNTNGSQMFFVDRDSTLAPKYNVFGTISEEGLTTLDAIIEENKDTEGANGKGGEPNPEVRITTATIHA